MWRIYSFFLSSSGKFSLISSNDISSLTAPVWFKCNIVCIWRSLEPLYLERRRRKKTWCCHIECPFTHLGIRRERKCWWYFRRALFPFFYILKTISAKRVPYVGKIRFCAISSGSVVAYTQHLYEGSPQSLWSTLLLLVHHPAATSWGIHLLIDIFSKYDLLILREASPRKTAWR